MSRTRMETSKRNGSMLPGGMFNCNPSGIEVFGEVIIAILTPKKHTVKKKMDWDVYKVLFEYVRIISSDWENGSFLSEST